MLCIYRKSLYFVKYFKHQVQKNINNTIKYNNEYYENHKEEKLIKFYERNYFEVGDEIEVFTPAGDVIKFTLEKLYDEEKQELDIARHPDNIYYLYLDTNIEIPEYSMIRLINKKNN